MTAANIDTEAERAAIGSVIVGGWRTWDRIRGEVGLDASDFASPLGIVWAAVDRICQRGDEPDAVSVHSELARTGEISTVGDLDALAGLSTHAWPGLHVTYARTIRAAAVARRASAWARKVAGTLDDGGVDREEIGSWLESRRTELGDLAQLGTVRGDGWTTKHVAGQVAMGWLAITQGTARRSSIGITALDRMLAPEPGDLIVVAGRPSMGKTALLWAMTREAVFDRLPDHPWAWGHRAKPIHVLAASGEQSPDQVLARAAADLTTLDSRAVRRPSAAWLAEHTDELSAALELLGQAPITWVPGKDAGNMDEIEGYARRWGSKHAGAPKMIWIDYLQLLRARGKWERNDLRVGDLALRAKELAKATDSVVVLAAQLNRKVDEREDHRPTSADLRDSGEIEQHADGIAFVYRECRYAPGKGVKWPGGVSSPDGLEDTVARLRAEQRTRGLGTEAAELLSDLEALRRRAEIIVTKARNGAIGAVPMQFIPEFTRFTRPDR